VKIKLTSSNKKLFHKSKGFNMSAKVKSISRGVIDTRNHKKHGIDVDLDELVSEISQVDPQEIPAPVDAKTSDLPKPMVLAPNRPVKGAHNSIIWSKEMDKPPAFLSIIRQIKGLFNVGTEVDGWTIAYFPPPSASKGGKSGSQEITIPAAPMGVAARYILCMGTKEVIHMATVQKNAEGKLLICQNQAINFPIGLCSQCTFSFNNEKSATMDPRPGFRQTRISKDPSSRHFLVLDGYVSVGTLVSKIKKEAKSATTNQNDANKLADKLTTMLELSDVDSVVSAATRKAPTTIMDKFEESKSLDDSSTICFGDECRGTPIIEAI
jgi:hypothetical protein